MVSWVPLRNSRTIKKKYLTAFDVSFEYVLSSRPTPNGLTSHNRLICSSVPLIWKAFLICIVRLGEKGWRLYYLRTLGASNIEKATVDLKKSKPLADAPLDEPSAKKSLLRQRRKPAVSKLCSMEKSAKLASSDTPKLGIFFLNFCLARLLAFNLPLCYTFWWMQQRD